MKKSRGWKQGGFAGFLGRQLSRLKMGQSYYQIIVSTISAISLLALAFQISLLFSLTLFPVMLLGAYFIGLIWDKFDIISHDYLQQIQMNARYFNVNDEKNWDIHALQAKAIMEALVLSAKGEKVNTDEILKEKYDTFRKKWSPAEK